ncbi:cytidylate kinase [Sulfolobales archaeon HS-7]|nr:cytidylate kinase [Sulfolobales archaeon HS-7]
MLIAISGPPGSGKTSVARKVAELSGMELVSGGMIFREMAKEKGISVIELNQIAEKDKNIDYYVDNTLVKMAKLKDNAVFESHLAGWLLRGVASYAVYLNAPIDVRSKRVADRDNISPIQALREIAKRELSHYVRFWELYGIDITDLSGFDLIISTEKLNILKVAEIILSAIKSLNTGEQF